MEKAANVVTALALLQDAIIALDKAYSEAMAEGSEVEKEAVEDAMNNDLWPGGFDSMRDLSDNIGLMIAAIITETDSMDED